MNFIKKTGKGNPIQYDFWPKGFSIIRVSQTPCRELSRSPIWHLVKSKTFIAAHKDPSFLNLIKAF